MWKVEREKKKRKKNLPNCAGNASSLLSRLEKKKGKAKSSADIHLHGVSHFFSHRPRLLRVSSRFARYFAAVLITSGAGGRGSEGASRVKG